MTVIREGNLEFTFGPNWKVLKYDQNGFFYKTQMENKIKPTKAVDFLCLRNDQTLLMLEVKDFSLAVPKKPKFNEVPMAVALKVRDTVAGIIGGSHSASDKTEQAFFKDSCCRMANPIHVFYLFEDLATPKRRPPQRATNQRSTLRNNLKRHLKWLTSEVYVIGLNDYTAKINDLTIRRV